MVNPRFANWEVTSYCLATPTSTGTQVFETSTPITLEGPVGATIYYTTDETNPTSSSTRYTAPFTITKRTTVKAIAIQDGWKNSDIMTSVYIAKKVYTATDYTNAGSPEELTISNEYTNLDNNLFRNNTTLKSVTILGPVTVLPDSTFNGCSNLETVNLPQELVTIGPEAFYLCEKLTYISLPQNVTTIGQSAFRSCTQLSNVTLANSIQEIRDGSFQGCTNLTSTTTTSSLQFNGTPAQWGAITKGPNWKLGVPATQILCNGVLTDL